MDAGEAARSFNHIGASDCARARSAHNRLLFKSIDMDDKQAIAVLTALLKKPFLTDEEKEAVLTAVGILSWSKLSESRIKALKANRDKKTH